MRRNWHNEHERENEKEHITDRVYPSPHSTCRKKFPRGCWEILPKLVLVIGSGETVLGSKILSQLNDEGDVAPVGTTGMEKLIAVYEIESGSCCQDLELHGSDEGKGSRLRWQQSILDKSQRDCDFGRVVTFFSSRLSEKSWQKPRCFAARGLEVKEAVGPRDYKCVSNHVDLAVFCTAYEQRIVAPASAFYAHKPVG
ncbi:hypothetical protein FA15DRAFT_149706 [Coprinopsis marcescibilis]|uniref:Uncharacterized protein n=1 Tax=Coprinopsis marcescibilis TaxID=230819 RepID=A0A5C3L4X5_COPMA|nr:hypothetical protein FA15DRAFT_149706 [Coprinopsis marcescibilis]